MCIYIYIYIHVYIYTCVYIYIYVYTCMYIYIYTYVHWTGSLQIVAVSIGHECTTEQLGTCLGMVSAAVVIAM